MSEDDKILEPDALAKILDRNPNIDRAILDRCREVERQLAAVGIKLGGYRLEPALGGKGIPLGEQPLRRRWNS